MANVKNNASAVETKKKLLAAAGRVFAENGFHSATIKQITQLAGASVASVNYHFNDKAELYQAVLDDIRDKAAAAVPPESLLVGDPETQLKTIIAHLCEKLIGSGPEPWEQVLMSRLFLMEPDALAPMITQVCRPLNDRMGLVVAQLIGRDDVDEQVALIVASIMGQVVYHLKHTDHLDMIYPQLGPKLDHVKIAETITALTLSGLQHWR